MVKVRFTTIREFGSDDDLNKFIADIASGAKNKQFIEALLNRRNYFFTEKDASYSNLKNYVTTRVEFLEG